MKTFIDINADLGEGINNEALLIPYISSCNIACGGHAGDKHTLSTVVKLAKQHRVKIGAHPSFPDQENFGRLKMEIAIEDLLISLKWQVDQLLNVLNSENESLHHIKPHGALYNLANTDEIYAEVIIALMKNYDSSVKLYTPYNSLVAQMAEKEDIAVTYETFADRNYNEDLTLVSRAEPYALIENSKELCDHVLNMILHNQVKTFNGIEKTIKAETICIHGDHPNAVQHLKILKECLQNHNIQIL